MPCPRLTWLGALGLAAALAAGGLLSHDLRPLRLSACQATWDRLPVRAGLVPPGVAAR